MVDLSRSFLESFGRHGARQALQVAGESWTYDALATRAASLMAIFAELQPGDAAPRVGILAERSAVAYQGILAAVLAGWIYVPLSPAHPVSRLLATIERARLAVLIVDKPRLGLARQILERLPWPITVLAIDGEPSKDELAAANGRHRLVTAGDLPPGRSLPQAAPARDDQAPLYLMFTSGTTGEPKGILIARRQVATYLEAVRRQFDFGLDDRCSQFFRLTFDLAVHDVLVTWLHGACLYVPSEFEQIDPVAFCRRHELTVWFSVPSMAALAKSMGKLKPNSLPSLRRVLFCGEALSWEVATSFQLAAPNARLTNLYGPTEATIAITTFDLPRGTEPAADEFEVVPIGRPFPGQEILILDEDLEPTPPGEVGELLLGGSQVAQGYLDEPRQTAACFLRLDHADRHGRLWYRTGDLVQAHPEFGLIFRGRKDDQIKLRGHRIELTEVEEALRRAAETALAIVAAWPVNDLGTADELIAFVCRPHAPVPTISARLAAVLPPYMLPRRIISTDGPRLTENLKLDRKQFVRQLTQPGDSSQR